MLERWDRERISKSCRNDGIFLMPPIRPKIGGIFMERSNRTLNHLRNSLEGKIYIYMKDRETAEQFLADAEEEGYRFGTYLPTENHIDDIIALERGGQLSHPGFVGHMAFSCNGGTNGPEDGFHRIDYHKYKSGAEDFYYHPQTRRYTVASTDLWQLQNKYERERRTKYGGLECPRCGEPMPQITCIKGIFGTHPAYKCLVCGHKWRWRGF